MFGKAPLLTVLAVPALLLSGCGPHYSPNVYSSDAVQHANKVDQGVLVGERDVQISADATVATATLGAAGGIAASQVGQGAVNALSTLGGTVAGGLVGNSASHATDTNGFEYIVRKSNGELMSVTQKDTVRLAIGQHVLIIEGTQARVVPDYTVTLDEGTLPHKTAETAKAAPEAAKPEPAKPEPTKPELAKSSLPAPEAVSAPIQPAPASAPTQAEPTATAHNNEDPAAAAPGPSSSEPLQPGITHSGSSQ